MKKFLCIIIALCTLFLCGCWDSKDPSRLAMITCVVMDIDDDNTYTVYTELLDTMITEATEPPEGTKSFHKSVGKTFTDAIYESSNDFGRELFGGVNKVRIFTQRYAERGFIDAIDFLLREPYTDETPHLIIYKSDAGDTTNFFDTKPTMDTLYGTYFENLPLTQIKKTSEGGNIQILDFIKSYMTDGIQPVAGVVEVKSDETDEKEKHFAYEGLAVFKEDKLVGYLDKTQTRAYNVITGKAKGFMQTIETDSGETVTVSVKKSKSDIKVRYENGKPTAQIDIEMKMTFVQQPSTVNTDKFDAQHMFEDAFAQKFEQEFSQTVTYVQNEYKSDIFGFGKTLMGSNYNTWLSLKPEWDDKYFPETDIKINVKCKLEHIGQINRSLKEKE